MKKVLSLIIALTLCLGFAVVPAYAYLDTPPAVTVGEVTAIATTFQRGQTVNGVRIEYPGEVLAGSVLFTDFEVDGYEIIAQYVNNDGVWQHAEAQGKYLFLEFAVSQVPGYSEGKTMQYYDGINRRRPITLNIKQNVHVPLIDGSRVEINTFINTNESNIYVDEYLELAFTNPADGSVLEYRLYIPAGYEAKGDQESIPLVVFLHGSGETGENNISPLLANASALEFSYDEAQAQHKTFVLVPQKPIVSEGWAYNSGTREEPFYTTSIALENVKLVVDELIGKYSIDTSRLYCTGLSMGSRGTISLNQKYPDMFAAMVLIASADKYNDEQIGAIKDKPLWFFLSADESESRLAGFATFVEDLTRNGVKPVTRLNENNQAWNGFLRGYPLELEAKAQWDESVAAGTNTLLTHYVPGTVIPSSHECWSATYSNKVVRDWLFSFSLETPYTPAK